MQHNEWVDSLVYVRDLKKRIEELENELGQLIATMEYAATQFPDGRRLHWEEEVIGRAEHAKGILNGK